ncbi:MAG: glutamate-5-semialdehyde dehydrogenase [Sporomusaceae bacterium]|nr:glutamate-5-semialdehyde dehydrogenase [Sporomusaceae bacterium]
MERELEEQAKQAKAAARKLAVISSEMKNQALLQMADALLTEQAAIFAANEQDLTQGRANGLSEALLDRLRLDEGRLQAMADGLRQLAALSDPIGETLSVQRRPNGLEIRQVRVPLGVIAMIYEARPNVTVDAAGICLKTGNAVVLRGGSEAFASNQALAKILVTAAEAAGIPQGAISLVATTDRQAVQLLLKMNRYIDVIIPRGGAGLIQTVVQNSTVPVIETGTGVCHTFIDESADLMMATEIAFNAKVSRPGVCNAMETLLVHKNIADAFMPLMLKRYREAQVELRGCEMTQRYDSQVKAATAEDWATEYHDYILSVKVVADLEEALEHIAKYSTGHSEAIVTTNYFQARRFQREVDAAAVYVNASTRFTDGGEFGFGAEIGISTQKLHARGPMGLKEMTSTKYLIDGDGQIR